MSQVFEEKLMKYAQVSIKVGLNLQPGQRLLIGTPSFGMQGAPIEAAPLVRHLAREAYKAGARLVEVMWGDDQVRLIRFRHAPRDSFEEFPVWRSQTWQEFLESGDAFLTVYGEDPELLTEQDPELISTVQQTGFKHNKPISALIGVNASNWLVIAVPVPGWTRKLFPDLSVEAGEARHWDAIFDICRIKGEDPVANWKDHIAQLATRCNIMNQKQYNALKLIGPGTELTIGLPEGHIWKGGGVRSQNGIDFTPNIPTEEIFTTPHRMRVEGVISGTKPLHYYGSKVEDFVLTFSDGSVIKASARVGESHLLKFLDSDEGARRLGEIALVPHSSPVSQANMLFYNGLIDENASSHIAIGRSFRFNMQNGELMTEEEFKAAGGNQSLIHIDMMIGSGELDVDGITSKGGVDPIMRAGEWTVAV